MADPQTLSAGSIGPKALRLAVANLLRLAQAARDDARLLLRDGQARHAAELASAALAHAIRAVAASEHGWRLGEWERGIAAIPKTNPARSELGTVSALAIAPPSLPLRADGQLVPGPDAEPIAHALDRLATMLETLAAAFDVDMAGTGPAGRVAPIRLQPAAEPKQPKAAGRNQGGRREQDRRRSATSLPRAEPLSAEQDQDPDPARVAVAVGPGSGPVLKSVPGVAKRSSRIVGKAAKTTPSPPPARATVLLRAPSPSPTASRSETSPTVTKPAQRTGAISGADAKPTSQAPTPPIRAFASGPSLTTPRAPDQSSAVFWSLMAHWKVADLAALELIGHPGGLTKKGTRPRFRVRGREAALLGFLQEIDAALQRLGAVPDLWLRQPIASAPFNGATPLEQIARQPQEGARDTIRTLMQAGLQGRI